MARLRHPYKGALIRYAILAAFVAALVTVGQVTDAGAATQGQFVKPCKKVSAKTFNGYLRKRQSYTGTAQRFTRKRVCERRLKALKRSVRAARKWADLTTRGGAMHLSQASWYGPGFIGNTTACGQRFYGQLGVAHKTLPCGTKVWFRYAGRTVAAPVIDRGPFYGNREWDLTGALKAALHFPSTGLVASTTRRCC